jgi:hypothetical protein
MYSRVRTRLSILMVLALALASAPLLDAQVSTATILGL